jgi:beta-glucosidase
VKQLVRFERLTLEPGETKTVEFELTPADMSVWNDRMERVVEPGKFVLMAGGNSRDVKTVEFELRQP